MIPEKLIPFRSPEFYQKGSPKSSLNFTILEWAVQENHFFPGCFGGRFHDTLTTYNFRNEFLRDIVTVEKGSSWPEKLDKLTKFIDQQNGDEANGRCRE